MMLMACGSQTHPAPSLPFGTETPPGRKAQNEGAIKTSLIISSSVFTACPVWWNWLS